MWLYGWLYGIRGCISLTACNAGAAYVRFHGVADCGGKLHNSVRFIDSHVMLTPTANENLSTFVTERPTEITQAEQPTNQEPSRLGKAGSQSGGTLSPQELDGRRFFASPPAFTVSALPGVGGKAAYDSLDTDTEISNLRLGNA